MGFLTSAGFALRIAFFFGILVCGSVMIGTLLMDNKDLKDKNSNFECPLTIRYDNLRNGSGACNFVIFTATAMIVMGFVFFTFALLNLIRGNVAT